MNATRSLVPVAEPRPTFFLIGAARSGTTGVVRMLRQHPDVFITQPKEPHFLALANRQPMFDGPGDDLTINRYAVTDARNYLSLYQAAGDRKARGDGSVSSLYYPDETLATLSRYFPEARLVVILREPVARAFSAYSYLRIRGFEPCVDFLDAVRQELAGQRLSWHHLWHYVGMGRYARQLRPFLEHLGPERIKVLFYDDFCRGPSAVAREVFRFVEVDPAVTVLSESINVSGTPRSAMAQRAITWTAQRPRTSRALRSVMPFSLREHIKRLNIGPAQVPKVASEMLTEVFLPEVSELRELLEDYYPGGTIALPEWLARTSV